jgi:6-phosphogluconolactonase
MSYHVYVTAMGADEIVRFAMDRETGAFDRVEEIRAEGRPAPIAVHPSGAFLYVARRGAYRLDSYAIDRTSGGLAKLAEIPLESDPCYLATDRTGRYLLSAYYMAERAAVHRIGADGMVAHPPIEWRHTGRGAHCFQTDRANRFAFVPHIAGNGALNAILQFRFDAETGQITPNAPERVAEPGEAGPRHFCFHPSKDLVYVSNEQGSGVALYGFDAEAGTLAHIETLSTLPAGWSGENTCAQIHTTPDGRFLYAPNRGHDTIAEFAVDPASGRLTPLGHAEAEPVPRAFAIDPAGRYLLSAGLDSGRLAVYRIGDDGRLDRIATHEVGAEPMWVTILSAA